MTQAISLDAMKQAARAAIGRTRTISNGIEPDPDLQRYMSLKPSDFKSIMEKYGVEDTISYIQTMEGKLRSKNETRTK